MGPESNVANQLLDISPELNINNNLQHFEDFGKCGLQEDIERSRIIQISESSSQVLPCITQKKSIAKKS
jgi:lipoate-protein ligase B